MFSESISPETKRVFEKMKKLTFMKKFYLAGGTALAVQLGHRESIDLDWFSEDDFSISKIKEEISKIGDFDLDKEEEGTLHGVLDGVKISFLNYPYARMFPAADFQGVDLADERDIAAMKIDAISSRGSKKDFVDLFFLFRKYSLEEMLAFFENKFKGIKYNRLHILKSLAYFGTADSEPMPKMLQDVDWEDMKKEIVSKVNEYLEIHSGKGR